jgi:hypothetical protein
MGRGRKRQKGDRGIALSREGGRAATRAGDEVVDGGLYVGIGKGRIAALGRHRALALEHARVERLGARLEARCPGGLVAELGRIGGAGGVASHAGRVVGLLAVGLAAGGRLGGDGGHLLALRRGRHDRGPVELELRHGGDSRGEHLGLHGGIVLERAPAPYAHREVRQHDDADHERHGADAYPDGERTGMRFHFLLDGVGRVFESHVFLGFSGAAIGSGRARL